MIIRKVILDPELYLSVLTQSGYMIGKIKIHNEVAKVDKLEIPEQIIDCNDISVPKGFNAVVIMGDELSINSIRPEESWSKHGPIIAIYISDDENRAVEARIIDSLYGQILKSDPIDVEPDLSNIEKQLETKVKRLKDFEITINLKDEDNDIDIGEYEYFYSSEGYGL